MNVDNIRKYILDIQISMGKILEEIQEYETTPTKTDDDLATPTLVASIPIDERNMIEKCLNNTEVISDEEDSLDEDDILLNIERECGIKKT